MSVSILSIPHTASTFVADQIFKTFRRAWNAHEFGANTVFAEHIDSPHLEKIAGAIGDSVIVIPMRHPSAVTTSWQRRGYDLAALDKLWGRLRKYESALFLPVDAIDRDQRLNTISNVVGQPLSTDWKPYNVNFGGGIEIAHSVYARWIVERFYGAGTL
ncbi:MAG: hypothetical protein JWM78_1661 [Verrucomicrobiaceae bacterium]|nr:hypothetical protein [Verrucomicrobiaceae bacterium]